MNIMNHYERIRARHNVRGLGGHIGLRCWQIDKRYDKLVSFKTKKESRDGSRRLWKSTKWYLKHWKHFKICN